jgi:hypothetical protein
MQNLCFKWLLSIAIGFTSVAAQAQATMPSTQPSADKPYVYGTTGSFYAYAAKKRSRQPLGRLNSNPYDPESTNNPYGAGNPYDSNSINIHMESMAAHIRKNL